MVVLPHGVGVRVHLGFFLFGGDDRATSGASRSSSSLDNSRDLLQQNLRPRREIVRLGPRTLPLVSCPQRDDPRAWQPTRVRYPDGLLRSDLTDMG